MKELQEVKYQNTTYYRRVEPKQTNYYYLRGPVFLFTSQEEMLRRAIDLDQHDGRRRAGAGATAARSRRRIGRSWRYG